jgi:acyl-CoA thioester hydrolase
MLQSTTKIRVRYAETDQMGYVYYGNYAQFFEVARVEMLRDLGVSYKQMEATGVMMPVLEYTTKYIRPAKYDELLTIKTTVGTMPNTRIIFDFETYNEANELINVAQATLVFVSTETLRPCRAPQVLAHIFDQYFV